MDILEAIKAGDEHAFKTVYLRLKEKVYFYLLKKCNNSVDAEELLQITFCKLWRYRGSINTEFLIDQHVFNITKQVFLDYIKGKNNQTKLSRSYNKTKANVHTGIASKVENIDLVRRALKEIPEIRRKVIWLNYIEGYSYQQIADELSLSIKSIDNHLSKGLKQLRSHVAKNQLSVYILTLLLFS